LECLFTFSLWLSLYFLLYQNECLRLVKRENKQEGHRIEKKEGKKETKERKLQRVRKEVFRTTRIIYIEPLASRITSCMS